MLARSFPLAAGSIELRFTERDDPPLDLPVPVLRVRQRHGRACAVFDGGDPLQQQPVADASVTAAARLALSVRVADCAPIALLSDEAVGVVHAGWRGIVSGVVPNAVTQLRALGARRVHAFVGPCIHEECYEFGEAELALVIAATGAAARGRDGRSLNLPAAVTAALADAGVERVEVDPTCTSCEARRCFSHRARRDVERHELIVWRR